MTIPELTAGLIEALASPEVRAALLEALQQAVPKNDTHELMTTAEAATLLRKTPLAVRRAATRGTLPVRRIGRSLRFRRSDLLALLEGRAKR